MATDEVPFELIQRPPKDLKSHDAAHCRGLLARRELPSYLTRHEDSALRYQPSDDLLLAINMALHTGSPLLLTGEPGTGKTQAAHFVGRYFDIPVEKFLVKSTSSAQDLMYEFDAIGYLHWAQAAARGPASEAAPGAHLAAETEAIRQGFLHKRALWQAYNTNGDVVVLIDEIDKAPRDFPNDLLHELDQHSFPHPFDHSKPIKPVSSRPPIVMITSNDERRLPDAFLRRCIYHRIELTKDLVEAAVSSMIDSGDDDQRGSKLSPEAVGAAQQRFWEIRERPGVDKKPTTAELLAWLSLLSAMRTSAEKILNSSLLQLPALDALIKDAEDRKRLG